MAVKLKGKAADGKEVEVEVESIPGYVAEATLADYVPKASHDQELIKLRGQLRDAIKHRREELLDDDEFKAAALESWGIKEGKGGGGGGKPDEKVLEKLRADILAKEVDPLKKQLEGSTATIEALQEQILHKRVMEVANGRVKPHLLKPGRPGAPPPLLSLLGVDFVYLDDVKDFAEYDPATEGPRLSPAGKKDGRAHNFRDVGEAFEEWAGKPENKEWLAEAGGKQSGAGFGGAGGGGSAGGVKTVDRNDPVAVGRNLEGIAKGEIKVV